MINALRVLEDAVKTIAPGDKNALKAAIIKVCAIRPSRLPFELRDDLIRILDRIGYDWRDTWGPEDEKLAEVRRTLDSLKVEDYLKLTFKVVNLQSALEKHIAKLS